VQFRYLLAVTLESTAVPLPVQPLQLRFGSPDGGLVLQCFAPPRGAGESLAVARGESLDLACDGLGDARWQLLLPTLIGAARSGGEGPVLIPPALGESPAQAERQLWKLWDPAFDEQVARWARTTAQARGPGPASRRWLPSPVRLAPPELLVANARPAAGEQSGARDLGPEFKVRLMVSVLALTLFAVGRLAMRHWELAARNMATAVMGALVAVPLVATVWGPGKFNGDGWANLGVFASGLALAMAVGVAVIIAMLLHWVHDLLDEDGQTWPGVIASGWRQALWMFGQATRGEFWGFVLFATWAWGLAVPLGKPWTGMIALALLIPLWSVTWRRALSLTRAEIVTGLLVIAVWVADFFLRHHL
jgi:hypothetical protein